MNGLKEAERIMGRNFIGPDDLRNYFGINFSRRQLEEIKSSWSRDFTGRALRTKSPLTPRKRIFEDHILWLSDKSFNINNLNGYRFSGKRQPKIFHHPTKDCQWYEEYPFVMETCRFMWYLSPLVVPDRFTEKSYKQQLQILPEYYFVLSATEEVYKSFIYFLKTGIRLNSNISARCLDSPMAEYNVNVGMFSLRDELGITCCPSDSSSSVISIAVSHKIACSSW